MVSTSETNPTCWPAETSRALELIQLAGVRLIALAADLDGQARFIVTVDEALVKRGLHAGNLARMLGERLGGKGGGRPDSAQGGSKEANRLSAALAAIEEALVAIGSRLTSVPILIPKSILEEIKRQTFGPGTDTA